MSVERVLVAGVYLSDRENTASHVADELSRSERWRAEQRWISLGKADPPSELAAITVERVSNRVPKFVLLNRLLGAVDWRAYSYILLCDDDIHLPKAFLDNYLMFVERHDFALAQPARTHDSYIDHAFVERLDGITARRTRFVEIGPLLSIRNDAGRLLIPFDEASPMGWGYDLVWPRILSDAELKLGIVDATPIAHRLRKSVAEYAYHAADQQMKEFLRRRPHLTRDEAFSIVESYA